VSTLVVIPTYKEYENLRKLVPTILEESQNLDVLVVDDNSKDGTDKLLENFQSVYSDRVFFIARKKNASYAKSLVEGFAFALNNGYKSLVQMDADGSHPPREIIQLLNSEGDVVIASRYVKGAKVNNVPLSRRLYSIFANIYISLRWKTSIRDKTNGFRLFRDNAFSLLSGFKSTTDGFAVQIEVLYYLKSHSSVSIVEVPTRFDFRQIGDSKFNLKKLVEAFKTTNKVKSLDCVDQED
jgi:dolichol-phosphate mannosyltransferase